MKLDTILVVLIIISSFSTVFSQDGTVVFDEEIYWEWPTQDNIYGGYGFYWWHRNEGTINLNFGDMSSTDWTQPDDYYNGELVLRFEILDQPSSEDFMLQMGIWQDKFKGGAHPETVSSRQYMEGGQGSVLDVSLGSPSNWWNKQPEDLVDFSRPEDFYRMGLVLWNPDPLCIPMGTDWSSSGCPENADKFFPLRARVRVLAFPVVSKSMANLSFIIKDEYSNTLQDASININGKQLKSNHEGIASIELEYGQYEYTVSKDSYNEVSGNVNLSETEVFESITLELISNVNALESKNINIYPNPADRYITIESESEFPGNTILEIYSIDGKKMVSKTLEQATHEMIFDVSGFEEGVYLLHILSEKERIVSRIVIR
ncbi:MAG: T9SS type A sorting domain-containing protein [Bacteroidales bacterium]